MAKKKRQDIDLDQERYGLFMGDEDMFLDTSFSREFMSNDRPCIIKYYRIDLVKSKGNNVYGESKAANKKFLPVVELNVTILIEDGEITTPQENGITRNDTGNLIFGVFNDELEEKQVEMMRGNYVSYNLSGKKERFYEISDADNVSDVTSKSRGGYKAVWKRITATPVHEDVVPMMKNS